MANGIKPWEVGSEFHWMHLSSFSDEPVHPQNAQLYSFGGTALTSLIRYGMASLGWKRMWIPTYNCPQVVDAIFSTGIETAVYFDTPFDPVALPKNVKRGDTIFIVNFFGVKSQDDYVGVFSLGIPVIEDHTHDPWSQWSLESRADYSIVSYRKTIPIPDGGAVWSNIGAPLPSEPVENDGIASEIKRKIEAMLLKTIYMDGGRAEKEKYLSLFKQSNSILSQSMLKDSNEGKAISTIARTILKVFPWRSWRKQRLQNRLHLLAKLGCWPEVTVLRPNSPEMCPFMVTLLFPSRQKRDLVNQGLIERSIYPAVHWPLDSKNSTWADERAIELSGRILSIHCDGRYGPGDLDRVSAALSECIDS